MAPVTRARPELTMGGWLRFDAITDRIERVRPRSIVEFGCGEGALGAWLARTYDYTGVEPDATSRSVAAQRLAANGRGRVLGAVEDLGDDRFDLVCAFEVLEHIDDDHAALRAWAAHLAPGGHLLLSVPAHQSRYGASDHRVGHVRRYDEAVLRATLADCGFVVDDLVSWGTGLGHALDTARNVLAKRRPESTGDAAAVERSAASGRMYQPRGGRKSDALWAIAAPFRLAQRPFAHTPYGIGWVVLARPAS